MIKILFMGRKKVGAQSLEWLLSQPEVEVVGVLTDSHLSVSPTRVVAERSQIPLFTYDTALEAMKSGDLSFDLGVSVVYWRVLKGEFLELPSLGNINFHPAPLPEYKGTAGYNLAVLNGLDYWAATAHYIDAGVDTGAIIDEFKFSIDSEEETAQTLEKKTQPFLLSLFKKTMRRVVKEGVIHDTRSNQGGRYVSRDDMERMKEIQEGDDIDRKIRAFWFPPYTGAYVKFNDKRYTLVNDQVLNGLADPTISSLFSGKVSR